MDLDLVVARLKTQLSNLRSVGTSADLEAALQGAVTPPAAFVLPLAEVGSDMGLVSSTSQRLVTSFVVVHCLSNRRDSQGGAALTDLKTARMALKQALIGWVPNTDTGEAVVFTSGRLLKLDDEGRLWWTDEFQLIDYYWSA